MSLMRRLLYEILSKFVGFYKGYEGSQIATQLTRGGAVIGEHVKFYAPSTNIIDSTRPWLLTIGDYTKITAGVVILTHDYSLSVMRRVYGEWIGEGAETVIGENCFLGINSVLLMGTHLGNNVIVGAGSVVHGTFPDNVVIAGNPAKIICTLDEHYKNRKSKTVEEAKNCAKIFYQRKGVLPNPTDLLGFKWLFTPRDPKIVKEYGVDSFFCTGDEPAEVEKAFYENTPHWNSFDDFLVECGLKK